MENPFDNLRKKREAAALLKQQSEETKRRAEEAQKRENERLFQQACAQYSPMVKHVLEQLREALYTRNTEIKGPYPTSHFQKSWEKRTTDSWRPVWELGYDNEEPISDTGPMTMVWHTQVKVFLDFDKKRRPVFSCQRGQSQPVTCPATENDLVQALTKLHE